MTSRRILITGAAGQIGKSLRAGFRGEYDLLRLSDVIAIDAEKGEEYVAADLRETAAVDAAVADVDCIVHLGGASNENPWDEILTSNIVGTLNVFEAAHRHKVKRVIYASSHHVVGYYRRDQLLDENVPIRPDGLYAVSKAYGEAVGRMFADKHGISVACVRIGVFAAKPTQLRHLALWLSPRDATQLFRLCINARDYDFAIMYGVSRNTRSPFMRTGAEFLGYDPVDDSEIFFGQIAADADNPVARAFIGGPFASKNYTGRLRT